MGQEALIHPCLQHIFLGTYYMLSMVLCSGDLVAEDTDTLPALMEGLIYWGTDNSMTSNQIVIELQLTSVREGVGC